MPDRSNHKPPPPSYPPPPRGKVPAAQLPHQRPGLMNVVKVGAQVVRHLASSSDARAAVTAVTKQQISGALNGAKDLLITSAAEISDAAKEAKDSLVADASEAAKETANQIGKQINSSADQDLFPPTPQEKLNNLTFLATQRLGSIKEEVQASFPVVISYAKQVATSTAQVVQIHLDPRYSLLRHATNSLPDRLTQLINFVTQKNGILFSDVPDENPPISFFQWMPTADKKGMQAIFDNQTIAHDYFSQCVKLKKFAEIILILKYRPNILQEISRDSSLSAVFAAVRHDASCFEVVLNNAIEKIGLKETTETLAEFYMAQESFSAEKRLLLTDQPLLDRVSLGLYQAVNDGKCTRVAEHESHVLDYNYQRQGFNPAAAVSSSSYGASSYCEQRDEVERADTVIQVVNHRPVTLIPVVVAPEDSEPDSDSEEEKLSSEEEKSDSDEQKLRVTPANVAQSPPQSPPQSNPGLRLVERNGALVLQPAEQSSNEMSFQQPAEKKEDECCASSSNFLSLKLVMRMQDLLQCLLGVVLFSALILAVVGTIINAPVTLVIAGGLLAFGLFGQYLSQPKLPQQDQVACRPAATPVATIP